MTLKFKDMIDLDYLLEQDEHALAGTGFSEKPSADTGQPSHGQGPGIAQRDRDIFNQLNGKALDERQVLEEWLGHRRRVYFEESGKSMLPGRMFSLACKWAARLLFFLGGFFGFGMAYSFLAYHGTRPVNVTLFFAIFILVPFVLFLFSLTAMLPGRKKSMIYSLAAFLVFKGIPRGVGKIGKITGHAHWTAGAQSCTDAVSSLVSRKKTEYGPLMFWTFFILAGLLGLGFSTGVLCATFFKVAVSDVAFGWQSSLTGTTGGTTEQVAAIVRAIGLPWSWFLPGAVPGPDQIMGSRIVLKQGLAALSTEHLVSWWPFLIMGILVYALFPRAVLVAAGMAARSRAERRFDINRPRFRKLLIRMQTPVMDIEYEESPAKAPDMPATRETTARPGPERVLVPDPVAAAEPEPALRPAVKDRPVGGPALLPAVVLAPSMIYDDKALDRMIPWVNRQLALNTLGRIDVSFDFESDRNVLESAADSLPGQVVLFQEVWQPPIRAMLHYITQLKTQVLAQQNLWILLTRTPGEKSLAVDPDDPDLKVWQTAVRNLGLADVGVEGLAERMREEG